MMRMRKALIGATLFAGLLGAPSMASAADDGYQDVFSSVATAVGLLKTDQSPDIDYRERAPLVLPPRMDLNQPTAPGAARTAAWPNDPDVIKRRKAAEDARAPLPDLLGNRHDLLSQEELRQGRNQATANGTDDCGAKHNARGCLVLTPDQLAAENERYKASGFFDKAKDKKELAAGEEPERLYLTQPPKGYMKTTKTVKATAEAPVPIIDQSNPSSALVYRKKEDE